MSWKVTPTMTWNETVWNPGMIQTSLWLDAADSSTVTTVSGAVSQWSDKSGNIINATQSTAANRPSYSNNTISFDGVNDFLQLSSPYGSTSQSSISFFAIASSNSPSSVYLGTADLTIFRHRSGLFSTQLRPADGSTVTGNAFIPTISDSNYHFQSVIVSGSSIRSWDDGTPNANFTGTRSLWNFGGTQYIARGDGSSGTSVWGISIREIIITSNALSDLSRQKIEGYLAWKWGLVDNLPSNHPYKSVGPSP